jgi:hypothetical protein
MPSAEAKEKSAVRLTRTALLVQRAMQATVKFPSELVNGIAEYVADMARDNAYDADLDWRIDLWMRSDGWGPLVTHTSPKLT